jgi:hypothetical protein
MGAPSKIAFGLWGREGTAHSRRLTPPSFAALTIAGAAFVRGTEPAAIFIHADVPQGHGGSLENRLRVVGPRGDRSLSAADAAFVRGTEPAAIFIPADVPQGHGGSLENRHSARGPACGAWSRLRRDADGWKGWGFLLTAWSQPFGLLPRGSDWSAGREGTAHSRRLLPPSFAAQKPHRTRVEPAAAVLIRADGAQGHRGSLPRGRGKHSWDAAAAQGRRETRDGSVRGARLGTAHSRRLTPPSFAALTLAGGAFVRGTEPAAIFIHADVPQGHGGSLENRLRVVGPRGNRSLSAADAAFVRGTETAAIFIHADVPQGHGGLVAALRAARARLCSARIFTRKCGESFSVLGRIVVFLAALTLFLTP